MNYERFSVSANLVEKFQVNVGGNSYVGLCMHMATHLEHLGKLNACLQPVTCLVLVLFRSWRSEITSLFVPHLHISITNRNINIFLFYLGAFLEVSGFFQ